MKLNKNLQSHTTSKIKLAAKRLFAAKGFDAVTVKEIGRKSRANPALINYHFGGKKELYYSIIEDFTSTGREFARDMLQKPNNAEQFLQNLEIYIRHLLQRYLNDPELHQLLHRECESALEKATLNRFEDQILEVFRCLEEFYQHAKTAGILLDHCQARTITLMLFCTLGMLCQRNDLHAKLIGISLKNSEDYEAIAQTLLHIYGHSLLRQSNAETQQP
jgi:AcrR family transcriptional regulator